MKPVARKAAMLAPVVSVLAVAATMTLASCGSGAGVTATTGATSSTAATTGTAAPQAGTTASWTTSGNPAAQAGSAAQASPPPGGQAPQPGPYTTMQAAEQYVKAQPDGTSWPLQPQSDDATIWRQNAVLNVIQARIQNSTGGSGDYYFFFVNGNVVGQQMFTTGNPDLMGGTDSSFLVRFEVYKPGDATCCPSGGESEVEFVWNGSKLVTNGSLQGAMQ